MTLAICFADDITYFKSAAIPAPSPLVLVGVLTAIKIISELSIFFSISVEKNKFLPLTFSIISFKPGS